MANWLDELAGKVQGMTAGEWEFGAGNDADGDSCDLLVADIADPGDGDPEYADVLFGSEIGEIERAANWDGIVALRNNAERLIAVARAAEYLCETQNDSVVSQLALDALRAALEGK